METLNKKSSTVWNFIHTELFFGAEIAFVKKVLWSVITTILFVVSPLIGASAFLSLCGLYHKKNGKEEVIEFVKITSIFTVLPVLTWFFLVLI